MKLIVLNVFIISDDFYKKPKYIKKYIFEFASRFVQNAIQSHLEKLLSKANGSK